MAGQEGFEPTTSGFGDRRSTNWSYWPRINNGQRTGPLSFCGSLSVVSCQLLNLSMQGVMATPLAVFLELQTVRHVPLVLRGGVIPAVALCTLERDVFLHEFVPSYFRAFVFSGKHEFTNDSFCLLASISYSSPSPQSLKWFRPPPCDRLHEWQSAAPSPWRSV